MLPASVCVVVVLVVVEGVGARLMAQRPVEVESVRVRACAGGGAEVGVGT